jgi:hypothetical protein
MSDQRRHPRVAISVSVRYRLPRGENVEGTATDLSMGGIFVQAEELPPYGSNLTIECALTENGPVYGFEGVVRWTKPDGFGVQFGLLGARETNALANFLRGQKPSGA